MFKRVLYALACLMVMAGSAQATDVTVTRVQSGVPVDTYGAEMTLYCAQFDNDQTLYFMSRETDEAWYRFEDVNFDGYVDFVTFPTAGAQNIFAEFYVYQPQTDRYIYAPVQNGQLCNYELDAQRQCVVSQVCDGIRDGDTWILAWKDGHLEPLRRLHIADTEDFAGTDSGYVLTLDASRYDITICDYTQNVNGEVIYAQTYPADETGELDGGRIAAARDALWNGLH